MDKIVFSCSGCSDLGQITDLTARAMSQKGIRKMHCLAAIGAFPGDSVPHYSHSDILVLDGCSVSCGKILLQKTGLENIQSVLLTDLGYKKGKTPVSGEIVEEILKKVATL